MAGIVYFIGAGPGDPGLLTLKGKEIIERADVIVYAGSLVNRQILSFARKDARIIDSAPLTLQEITGEMVTAAKKGMTVARVHSGDPSVYGAIAEQMEVMQKENIPCEVIPGVASVFAAAASLKMEYTLPGITQTLILTRRTGRTLVPEKESLSSLAGHRASMAIFLSIGVIDETVRELMEGGYPKDTPAAVVHKASWPDEKRVEGTLETIAEKVKQEGITRQALILVGEAVGRHKGEPSKLYAPDFTHGVRVAKGDRRAGPAVVALTRRGCNTGRRILHAIDEAELFLPVRFREEIKEPRVSFYEDVKNEIERLFQYYGRIVLIMATGVAVRIVTPFLTSKWEDPAVVTMDDGGRNIISLLSGHWGGANELVMKLSGVLGGNPVITTESDVMGFPSVDTIIKSLTAGRFQGNKAVLRDIQTAVLEGEDVAFYPKELCLFPNMKGHPNLHFFDSIEALVCSRCTAGLIFSHKTSLSIQTHRKFLLVHPRDLVVGIGCHKGIKAEEIEMGIQTVFQDMNLSLSSIALLCSIEQKKGEKGLIDYARLRGIPLKFFSSEEINHGKIVSPESKHALKVMGVHGIAEPCATLGAGDGKLLMHKVKLKNMTVAVAKLPLKQLIEESEETGNE
jgi:precorrin-4 C11-methyltransferase